ncbi:tetratricopeptide repeat protein [Aureibaculum conchae]|uniref:tetratricopeptide repeat protein n=1 Tax=Aureibaculum sp. 2308TA14-22 TaxID=3108392 RepID=UPI00339814E5
MATYKKKGGKANKDRISKIEEESTTAEVFNTLDETASRSEKWVEKNSKPLMIGLVTVAAVILGYLAYNKFVKEPKGIEAANELAYPKSFFDQAESGSATVVVDSLYNLALNGADGRYGLLDIIDNYGSTDAGNLAKYMAGISYLKTSDYENAIELLSDFSTDDEILGAIAEGNIGDAFSQINQPEDAMQHYIKAADFKSNEFTSSLYLFKAGNIAMDLGNYSKAEELFTKIKNEYPNSDEGTKIDIYLNRARLSAQN